MEKITVEKRIQNELEKKEIKKLLLLHKEIKDEKQRFSDALQAMEIACLKKEKFKFGVKFYWIDNQGKERKILNLKNYNRVKELFEIVFKKSSDIILKFEEDMKQFKNILD